MPKTTTCSCGKPKDYRAKNCKACANAVSAKEQWQNPDVRSKMMASIQEVNGKRRKCYCIDCGKYRRGYGSPRCRKCWEIFVDQNGNGRSPDAIRRGQIKYKAKLKAERAARRPPADICQKCGTKRPPKTRCPECNRAKQNRRRAKKALALGSHTNAEWLAIVKKQKDRCANCHRKTKLQRDHIVPISRGGSNFAFNIQGLCISCNASKHAKITTPVVSLFDKVA